MRHLRKGCSMHEKYQNFETNKQQVKVTFGKKKNKKMTETFESESSMTFKKIFLAKHANIKCFVSSPRTRNPDQINKRWGQGIPMPNWELLVR